MNDKLEWRAIPNTNYLISENGDIFSKRSNTILLPQVNKGGYLQLTLYLDGVKTPCRIHRLVGKYFLEEKEGLQINHKDGNKLNNHFSNLEYVTSKENHRHGIENGLFPIGSLKPGAKLDEDDVRIIKKMMVEGMDDMEISEITGVVTATISKIRHKKRWSHVLPELELPSTNGTSKNSRGKKKLEAEDIPEIRKLYRDGMSLAAIGRLYHVHSGTIDAIIKRKTWKNY